MAPPRKLVAVMKTRREAAGERDPIFEIIAWYSYTYDSADAEGSSRLFVEDGVFEIGFESGAADSPAGTIRPARSSMS